MIVFAPTYCNPAGLSLIERTRILSRRAHDLASDTHDCGSSRVVYSI